MAGSSTGWFKSTKGAKGRTFIAKSALEAFIATSPRYAEAPGSAEDHLALLRADLRSIPSYVTYVARKMGAAPPKGMAKTKKVERTPRPPRAERKARPVATPAPAPDRAPAPAPAAPAAKPEPVANPPATGVYTGPSRDATARRALGRKIANQAVADGFTTYVDEFETRNIATMKRVIAETDLSMRVPSAVLESILAGGFKNQHQTKTSGGMLSPTTRANAEHKMFGIPKDSRPEDYPVYGYLTPKVGEVRGATAYGNAQVIFKEAVRDRTTFSVGDSLSPGGAGRLMPAPIHAPDLAAVSGVGGQLFAGHDKPTVKLLEMSSYFEIQIHGKTTAADIAMVRFDSSPSPSVVAKLDELGIAWSVK